MWLVVCLGNNKNHENLCLPPCVCQCFGYNGTCVLVLRSKNGLNNSVCTSLWSENMRASRWLTQHCPEEGYVCNMAVFPALFVRSSFLLMHEPKCLRFSLSRLCFDQSDWKVSFVISCTKSKILPPDLYCVETIMGYASYWERGIDQLWLYSWDRVAFSIKDVGGKPDLKVARVFISDSFCALTM